MPGFGQSSEALHGVIKSLSQERCLGVARIVRHYMGLSYLAEKYAWLWLKYSGILMG